MMVAVMARYTYEEEEEEEEEKGGVKFEWEKNASFFATSFFNNYYIILQLIYLTLTLPDTSSIIRALTSL